MTEPAVASSKTATTYVIGIATDNVPEAVKKRGTPRARRWADVYQALAEMPVGKWLPVQFSEDEEGKRGAMRLRHAVAALGKKLSLGTIRFTTRWDPAESVLYINKALKDKA